MSSYIFINNIEDLEKVKDNYLAGKVCGVDSETTGLDPLMCRLRLLQIAVAGEQTLVIDCFELLPVGKAIIQEILDSFDIKVFQNAKFDIKFLKANGLEIKGQLFDTMLAGQLLRTSGGPRRVALAELANHYLGVALSKEQQRSDFSGKLSEEQLEYGAKDAEILLKLRGVMILELKENKLIEVARVEFACCYAIAHMEYFGIHVDLNMWQKLTKQIEKSKEECLNKLYPYIGYPTVQLGLFEERKISDFNPNSHKQILSLLEAQGIHVDNTSKHALALHSKNPFVKLLLEYRHLEKQLNTFLHTIPDQINPVSKRLHPNYGQNGAFSGRMSCGNPNIQQIPREKEFRACFNGTKGRKLVIADYSQIELRVIAQFANDTRMIQAYKDGEDLHRLTASLVLQKDIQDITKEERQAAKAVNFGLVFGMGAAGLKSYAANTYGTTMTMEEAELFKKRYFVAYKGVNNWHWHIKKTLPISSRTLAGRKHNYGSDSGMSGRFNTPVQGTAADILKNALGQLYLEIQGTSIIMVAVVHDEIVLECDASEAEQTADLLKRIMEEAGNRYLKDIPVIAEVSISDSWAGK